MSAIAASSAAVAVASQINPRQVSMPIPIKPMLAATVSVLFLLLPGCSGSSRPRTVPVTGKVTWDGQPLTEGTVVFVPTASDLMYPANGILDSSGTYKLSTFELGDGVLPGEYQITVSVFEGADPSERKLGTKMLPDRYYQAATSGLTAMISPDEGSQTIDLELEGNRQQ